MKSPGHGHQACVPARTRVDPGGREAVRASRLQRGSTEGGPSPGARSWQGAAKDAVGIPLVFVLRSPPGHTFSI